MIISQIYKEIKDEKIIPIFSFNLFLGALSGFLFLLDVALLSSSFGLLISSVFLVLAVCAVIEPKYIISLFFSFCIFFTTGFIIQIIFRFNEIFPMMSVTSIIGLIISLIILTELLFWLSPKEKVKKKDLFCHTLKRKSEALFEVLMAFSFITLIYIFAREIEWMNVIPIMLKWVGWFGLLIVLLILLGILFYLFIKLNSIKYRK